MNRLRQAVRSTASRPLGERAVPMRRLHRRRVPHRSSDRAACPRGIPGHDPRVPRSHPHRSPWRRAGLPSGITRDTGYAHVDQARSGFGRRAALMPATRPPPILFKAAGVYAYHCKIHPFMHGKVRVPIEVSPASGSEEVLSRSRSRPDSAPSGRLDVQKKAGAGLWKIWKTGVTSLSVTFHHASPGSWRFRSRQHRTRVGPTNGLVAAEGDHDLVTFARLRSARTGSRASPPGSPS